MSTNIRRFCEPDERKHLVLALAKYRAEEVKFKVKLQNYQILAQQKMMAMPNKSGDDVSASIGHATQAAARESLKDPAFVKALKMVAISDRRLREQLNGIARHGYLHKSDLRRSSPDWAFDAFSASETETSQLNANKC